MFSKEVFCQRLRAVRKAHGETQTDLGNLLGIRKSRISEIESGITSASAEKIYLICEHYGVSADYLLGLTDEA